MTDIKQLLPEEVYEGLVNTPNTPSALNYFLTLADLAGGSGWLLNGNTDGVLQYIGTNDAFDFPIYTSGVERARFNVSGNFVLQGSIMDSSSLTSINPTARTLVDVSGIPSTDYSSRILLDASAGNSILWDSRQAFSFGGTMSLDWESRDLLDTTGLVSASWDLRNLNDPLGTLSLDWNLRQVYTSIGSVALDWENRYLHYSGGSVSADWETGILYDASATFSIDYLNRQLREATAGVTLDYNLRRLLSVSGATVPIWRFQNAVGGFDTFYGTASPETVVIGTIGDLFIENDGSTGRMYIKQSGVATNTGWALMDSNVTDEWLLSGNTLTGVEWFGSINNQAVTFRVNSTEVMQLNTSGHTNIGAPAAPVTAKLSVRNTSASDDIQRWYDSTTTRQHTFLDSGRVLFGATVWDSTSSIQSNIPGSITNERTAGFRIKDTANGYNWTMTCLSSGGVSSYNIFQEGGASTIFTLSTNGLSIDNSVAGGVQATATLHVRNYNAVFDIARLYSSVGTERARFTDDGKFLFNSVLIPSIMGGGLGAAHITGGRTMIGSGDDTGLLYIGRYSGATPYAYIAAVQNTTTFGTVGFRIQTANANTPLEKFTIEGDSRIVSGTSSTGISAQFHLQNVNALYDIQRWISDGGFERMRVTDNGNVNIGSTTNSSTGELVYIGTSNPSSGLRVDLPTLGGSAFKVIDGTYNAGSDTGQRFNVGIFTLADNITTQFNLDYAVASRLRIDNGASTTDFGTDGGTNTAMYMQNTNLAGGGTIGFFAISATQTIAGSRSQHDFVIRTDNIDRITVLGASGYAGFGISVPLSTIHNAGSLSESNWTQVAGGAYAVLLTDLNIESTVASTPTLPLHSTAGTGKVYRFFANPGVTITITANAADNIFGAATYSLVGGLIGSSIVVRASSIANRWVVGD